MEERKIISILKSQAEKIGVTIEENQAEKFINYMKLLLEWNEKMNLTAITDPNEIVQKHFIDSLTVLPYINENTKMIDVGTGAGFPAIPLKIANESTQITLLDSLNKRLNFLNEVITKLQLKEIVTVHGRAEETGKNKKYREQYNIAISRAVASLNVLVEYLLPFVKVNGICICMKGNNVEEELKNSKKAIEILGGKIEKIEEMTLPDSDIKRNIIIIRKVKQTPNQYPRKAGTPSKEPIK